MAEDQTTEQSGKWEMGKEKEREVREGKGCTGHRKRRGEGKKRKEEENERGSKSYVKDEGPKEILAGAREEEEKEGKKRKNA